MNKKLINHIALEKDILIVSEVPLSIKNRIQKDARKNCRSMSKEIKHIIVKYYEQIDSKDQNNY